MTNILNLDDKIFKNSYYKFVEKSKQEMNVTNGHR